MRKQITHISIHQTSKVIAAMHAAMISVLFVLPTVLSHLFHGKIISGLLILILVPFFIWLFMYIGYVIACWFYNLVVRWMGGIEIEVKDISVQTEVLNPQEPAEVAPAERQDVHSESEGPVEKL